MDFSLAVVDHSPGLRLERRAQPTARSHTTPSQTDHQYYQATHHPHHVAQPGLSQPLQAHPPLPPGCPTSLPARSSGTAPRLLSPEPFPLHPSPLPPPTATAKGSVIAQVPAQLQGGKARNATPAPVQARTGPATAHPTASGPARWSATGSAISATPATLATPVTTTIPRPPARQAGASATTVSCPPARARSGPSGIRATPGTGTGASAAGAGRWPRLARLGSIRPSGEGAGTGASGAGPVRTRMETCTAGQAGAEADMRARRGARGGWVRSTALDGGTGAREGK